MEMTDKTTDLVQALREQTVYTDKASMPIPLYEEARDRLESLEQENRDFREALEVLHEANNIYAVSSKANADDLRAYIEKALSKHPTTSATGEGE